METPVKAGAGGKYECYRPKYYQAMDSELLEVGLSSSSIPKP